MTASTTSEIPTNRHPHWSPCLLACLLAFLGFSVSSLAQDVRAELSSSTTTVGKPVELRITATGKSQGQMMDELAVDGIEVVSTSTGFQMQMGFPGGKRVTKTWSLMIVPTRPGEFSIPPMRVKLDGKVFKTLPTVLTAVGGGQMPVRPAIPVPQGQAGTPSAQDGGERKVAFGELVIPKQSAYVGEVVPVDLRFYLDGRYPAQFSERPNFGGDGFTVQRFAKPTEVDRNKEGVPYSCILYRTAITPAKAGTLEIPKASVDVRVQVPMQAPRGMDDFLGGMFQNFGMSDVKETQIETEPGQLEVKPLPAEGRPESFDGAVGDFQLHVAAEPSATAPGEPITLKATISGYGNFEAMGAPRLMDTEGWRVYDPSDAFQPSSTDPIGFAGEKTYTFTIVARKDQKATPALQFSFFNPATEKYETLEGAPIAINAQGSGQAAPAVAAPASPPATAQATPPPATSGDLIRNFHPSTFQPLAWAPGFAIAGGALGGLWLIGLGIILVRWHRSSPAAAKANALRALRSRLKALQAPELDTAEFLGGAHAFMEARIDGPSHPVDPDLLEKLHAIRQQYEVAKFSTRAPASLDAAARKAILDTLHQLDIQMKH